MPNATTGTDTVLRALQWEEGDVVLCYEVAYGALQKQIARLAEECTVPGGLGVEILDVGWPVGDDVLVEAWKERIREINGSGSKYEGRRVKLAVFDTIVSMPGVRVPWERLVAVCREEGVLSLVDGAHGLGHISLDMQAAKPDFFVTNVHK